MEHSYKMLEKEMATHSSIPAWEIPWTEEPGGLQSLGSKRVLNTTKHIKIHPFRSMGGSTAADMKSFPLLLLDKKMQVAKNMCMVQLRV